MSDFVTFDEALEKLQVDAEELKEMISDEEIRAFRDGGKLKFKRAEIEHLKEQLDTEPTIILSSDEDIPSLVEGYEDAPAIVDAGDEEMPMIEGIGKEALEEAPAVAGAAEIEEAAGIEEIVEEEPAVAEIEEVAGIEEIVEEEPAVAEAAEVEEVAGIEEIVEEEPAVAEAAEVEEVAGIEEIVEEEPAVAEIEEPAFELPPDEEPEMVIEEIAEETAPTMVIDELEDGIAATVEMAPMEELADIGLKEDTVAPPDEFAMGDLEEIESATVVGEEDLIMPLEGEDELVAEPELEEELEEKAFAHAVSAPAEVYAPVHPIFTVMLIFGILVLIFAGIVVVDLVREPVEMPGYLKDICEALLG